MKALDHKARCVAILDNVNTRLCLPWPVRDAIARFRDRDELNAEELALLGKAEQRIREVLS